ncbi:hypothetical protein FSP39_011405 [Pinctada imbricata]|uniref:Uncharacterized protein n=1 Tax=Pinctada imbricata TaxID=66713 RepID=A0AA88YE07_PINIB|nr:hypothetical protein FSP39_011405 [Pinctada imbricata]
MRKINVAIMTGLAFTFGIFLGLVIQLPVIPFPADDLEGLSNSPSRHLRIRRSLQNEVISGQVEGRDLNSRMGSAKSLKGGRDQILLQNPLSGLKPSLYGVVYPENNRTNSYLAKKTQTEPRVTGNYKDKTGTAEDLNIVVITQGKSPAKQNNTQLENTNNGGRLLSRLSDIVSGIFWSPRLEKECPKGFADDIQQDWKDKAKSMKIVKMEEGCGRMQNRLITFKDTTHACARYRLNTDQMQGEIFSFYLAKLLGINNVPPTSLHVVNSDSDQWSSVHSEIANSQWGDGKVVILTQYIEGLEPSYIPLEFRENNRKLHPTARTLLGTAKRDLCDLVQWSDLIIFDYLTANLDRVVNNMFNKQWNDQMMDSPAHNLERSRDGQLVFLDNESGLFHGYRLLDKYANYHKSLLDSLCVFRPSTAEAIEKLHTSQSIGDELHKLYRANEEFNSFIPKIP